MEGCSLSMHAPSPQSTTQLMTPVIRSCDVGHRGHAAAVPPVSIWWTACKSEEQRADLRSVFRASTKHWLRTSTIQGLPRSRSTSSQRGCCKSRLICDLNNSAAVGDELIRRHVPLGVIGLPTDDFKVSNWLGFDVINGRQHRHLFFVGSPFCLACLVVVLAKQFWIELGTVVGIKAGAAMKCLVDGLYCFLDAVFATSLLVAPGDRYSLPLDQFAVFLIAFPNPSRSTPTHIDPSLT